jgi:hypothetical protein
MILLMDVYYFVIFFKTFFRYFEITIWSKEYICCGEAVNKRTVCDEDDQHWRRRFGRTRESSKGNYS